MHVEVMGWVREAEDEDERERLRDLATEYLSLAVESGRRENDRLRSGLPRHVLERLEGDHGLSPDGQLEPGEVELVRAAFAISGVAALETLSSEEMHDLADMMEGWAQDPKCSAINVGRLLGM